MASNVLECPALLNECAQWLAKWKVLPNDFAISQFDPIHFCRIIQDGYVLCQVICKMDPLAIKRDDICSSRLDTSQYSSMRNIHLFIKACRNSFQLEEDDLFEPSMLYFLTDIGKVMNTLSILSNTRKATRMKIEGFPKPDFVPSDSENDYDYICLIPDAMDDTIGDSYEDTYQQLAITDYDDDIYYDTIYMATNSEDSSRLTITQDKKHFCVKELIDTEWNYLEILKCIKLSFIDPLSGKLSQSDMECIFHGIEKLHEIHSGFYSDLLTAYSTKLTSIYTVFVNWKTQLIIYGEVCANLPKAQDTIRILKAGSEEIAKEIEACERHVRETRGKLVELTEWITIPFQRVLRYPLILRNIPKTELEDDEREKLEEAIECMGDLSNYINEAKRDYENCQTTKTIQASISGWNMTSNLSLTDYGRLIKDGELSVLCPGEQGNPKLCYVFLFTRVLIVSKLKAIMEKMLGGDQYVYKADFILDDYKLEDNVVTTNQTLGKKQSGWSLSNHNKKIIMTVKSPKEKKRWVDAICEALDDLCPAVSLKTTHSFILHTFSSAKANSCDACKKLLKGLVFQGYLCKRCNLRCHKDCIVHLAQCLPPSRPSAQQNKLSPIVIARVRQSLDGQPWFAGDTNRRHAEAILRGTPSGTYLVRYNITEKNFALSLKTATGAKHMKVRTLVCPSGKDKFYLSESFTFDSILELVNFYRTNNLRESFVGLDAFLRYPFRSFADDSATAGDNIYV